MSIAYVNGLYTYQKYSFTHINDRGYQFADAAYEVVLFMNGVGCDTDLHLDRLDRTLEQLKITNPFSRKSLIMVMDSLLEKNKVITGTVYIQISRGVAPRNHPFPKEKIQPVVVMTVKPLSEKDILSVKNKKLALTLRRDYRWGRCDLKTVGLLPNVLMMQDALESGFDDALLYDDQGITEGTSWNFWIINAEGSLQTRPLGNEILHGITRRTILEIAEKNSKIVIEKPITIQDLTKAQEAFASSATKIAMAVKQIDDIKFSDQAPITNEIFDQYISCFKS